jgi:alkylated DNA repair dioxygenase AlkB
MSRGTIGITTRIDASQTWRVGSWTSLGRSVRAPICERMNAPSCRRVRPSSHSAQTDLFAAPTRLLEGFRYYSGVLTPEEEEALTRELANLPLKPFDFQGFLANRRVVSFGYRYDYERRAVVEAAPLPLFLIPLRRKVAELFDRPVDAFRQVLINEYRPGAGIGWHRDKAQFDEVVGVSLLHPGTLHFRRKAGERWDRASLTVAPRSAYLLSGPSRAVWEHSIPALDRLRYSITLRTLIAKATAGAASDDE